MGSETEREIRACVQFGSQRSFLLTAGAGSGKTRALVNAVRHALLDNERRLAISGSRIAVVTYTKAARDEVKRRLDNDPRVAVSTIHSFAWRVIKDHPPAIKIALTRMLHESREATSLQESKGQTGTPASDTRLRKIAQITSRLERLPSIREFSYSPDRDTPGRDELSHHEVISIFGELLNSKPILAQIMVSQYPVLLVDEVQDTSKTVLPSIISVSENHPSVFTLGLFGDLMQRVYLDGVPNLLEIVPEKWARPEIDVNYRSAARIVSLANSVRDRIDRHVQVAAREVIGTVRVFLAKDNCDRQEVESYLKTQMAVLTADIDWDSSAGRLAGSQVKMLVLEHSLAAERLGFREFFDCFPAAVRTEILGQGVSVGVIAGFLGKVAELAQEMKGDNLRTASLLLNTLRSRSHLYEASSEAHDFDSSDGHQQGVLRRNARELKDTIAADEKLSMFAILNYVRSKRLFALPEQVSELCDRNNDEDPSGEGLLNESIVAWRRALDLPWSQVANYVDYINGRLAIDTQQGVKGLEFERVLVVLDDSQASGNLFSYDRLMGIKSPSSSDLKNQADGKDTSFERTLRLFYVACTRAKNSLAIVHYSADPDSVRSHLIASGWFGDEELEVVGSEFPHAD